MGFLGRKKKTKENSNSQWTSFEFVQFVIKYPDTSDENFVMMYDNLLGEDNLEKDMENYWKNRLDESFISEEEFKKIRKLSKITKETDDLARWAVTNTDDDRINDENV